MISGAECGDKSRELDAPLPSGSSRSPDSDSITTITAVIRGIDSGCPGVMNVPSNALEIR